MIEVFTDGAKPYSGMANAAVISKVQGGYRAEQPTMCSDKTYAVLLACWASKPGDRPTFAKLVTMLEGMVAEGQVLDSRGTSTPSSLPRQAIAVNDTYAGADASTRQAVAINSTYAATGEVIGNVGSAGIETAEAADGDHCLTVDNTASAHAANDADDEYLAVASQLQDDDNADFEC